MVERKGLMAYTIYSLFRGLTIAFLSSSRFSEDGVKEGKLISPAIIRASMKPHTQTHTYARVLSLPIKVHLCQWNPPFRVPRPDHDRKGGMKAIPPLPAAARALTCSLSCLRTGLSFHRAGTGR